MLHPRIIPCLLIRNMGLVKTVKFSNPKYIGDPINAVKIFNEKESDELIVLDIDATTKNFGPNYTMIGHLAAECRMPLCYGGGIKTAQQAREIIGLGVEKVAISSVAIENPSIITEISREIGCQSVVIVIDVKKNMFTNTYEIFTHNGKVKTEKDLFDFVIEAEHLGAGEILINSIDNDGEMKGYDLSLAKKIREKVSVPITILGGAGTLSDIGKLIQTFGIVGAAAGSLFVFKGIYKAVLINYPDTVEKERLINDNYPK